MFVIAEEMTFKQIKLDRKGFMRESIRRMSTRHKDQIEKRNN